MNLRRKQALIFGVDDGFVVTLAQTDLLLVADPVRRLQAPLQKGKTQFVDGRFVEIVLHKAIIKQTQGSITNCHCI